MTSVKPLNRLHAFLGMTEFIKIVIATAHRRAGQRQCVFLPIFVKDRLVLFPDNRAEPRLAAKVMRAVQFHHGPASLLTPIIESRVTSSARAASSSPSVPAGRSGSTI